MVGVVAPAIRVAMQSPWLVRWCGSIMAVVVSAGDGDPRVLCGEVCMVGLGIVVGMEHPVRWSAGVTLKAGYSSRVLLCCGVW